MKILIVEDEADLVETISSYLGKEGHVWEIAIDFFQAEEKIGSYHYDVVILDITLPHGNGLDILKKLKSMHLDTGVIIVSAKNSLDDKINGLNLGADDYITKPFHLSELNARIKALIRRKRFEGSEKIEFNEIYLFPENNEIKILDKVLDLTKKEFELLFFFVMNKNRLLSKESIAEHLWGDAIDMADNFDFIYTHINNLRKKIEIAGGNDYIKTIYGSGYKFTDR